MKFGCDFLLYPFGGPELFHAQYSVLVRINGAKVTWNEVSGLNRVTEAAGKELVIVEVESKEGKSVDSIHNLSEISLKETLIKRFLPQEHKQ